MSIITAVIKDDRIAVAADSLVMFGDSERMPIEIATTKKIWRLGDVIMGGAGWALYDDILRDHMRTQPTPALSDEIGIFSFFNEFWKALHERYSLVNDQASGKDTPFGDLDSTFLIVNRNGIFKVSSDMGVTRLNRYYAIGSGSDYAMGAMRVLYDDTSGDASFIATRAVEIAIDFDISCGGPVHQLTIPAS